MTAQPSLFDMPVQAMSIYGTPLPPHVEDMTGWGSEKQGYIPLPPHNGTDTSRAAAVAIAPVAGTLMAKVYDFIEAMGIAGALEEEIALGCGMRLSSVCARVNELAKQGLVSDSGERRRTTSGRFAAVFVTGPVRGEARPLPALKSAGTR